MVKKLNHSQRLNQRKDFKRSYEAGILIYASGLKCRVLPPLEKERKSIRKFGVIVSSKLGNAVKRNHIKRQLRTLFQAHQEDLPENCDTLLIAQNQKSKIETEAWKTVFKKAHEKWKLKRFEGNKKMTFLQRQNLI